MNKIITSNWLVGILLLLSILVVWPLFQPGYFSHHDDLHVMRIYEMRKCLADLQIPCRWVPDMGYGYGFPLFNFYNPFAYYIGALASFGIGFIGAAKLLFLLPLVLAPVTMYLLGKELFGKKGGFISGCLYLFAPYRAVDAYVRGAVAESFSIALVPLVFLLMVLMFKRPSVKFFSLNALIFSFFLTSHNISAILFAPLILGWFIILAKNYNLIMGVKVGLSFLMGIGLSAFFIIPAFFEKSLAQTENLIRGDLNFRAHFVTVYQLFFDRNWGYGASVPGVEDGLSFQIGWPHWWMVVIAFIAFGVGLILKKIKFSKQKLIFVLMIFAFLFFWFSIFMMHNKSAFIWEQLPVLQYTQFPWRFLSTAIFCASLIGGFLIANLEKKIAKMAIIIVVLITVLFNAVYFVPEKFNFEVTDQSKLSGEEFEIQQKAAIFDYLPKGVIEPKEAAPSIPFVKTGVAEIASYDKKTNKFNFKADAFIDSVIVIPIFYFPGWNVRVNNQDITIDPIKPLGLMGITLSKGEYIVEGSFVDTPIRRFANLITVSSVVILLGVVLYGTIRKKIR